MQCPKCSYEPTMAEMQRSPDDCVKCGVNYLGHARHVEQKRIQEKSVNSSMQLAPVVRDAVAEYRGAQPVVVVDVRMSFSSMVVFMVKWVLASIPAAIILAVIIGVAYGLISAVPSYFYYKDRFDKQQNGTAIQKESDGSVGALIHVSVFEGISYYAAGRALADNAAVLTVRAVARGGQTKYSKIGVDCRTAIAVVTDQADTLAEISSYKMPVNYEKIIAGTTRWHIARYACVGADQISSLLE